MSINVHLFHRVIQRTTEGPFGQCLQKRLQTGHAIRIVGVQPAQQWQSDQHLIGDIDGGGTDSLVPGFGNSGAALKTLAGIIGGKIRADASHMTRRHGRQIRRGQNLPRPLRRFPLQPHHAGFFLVLEIIKSQRIGATT